MTNTLVLTHSADHDGLASQAIARKALGETNVTYQGWDYGDDIPDLAPYTTIYLIDISLPKDVMTANAEKLQWVDHHASALREMPTYITGYRIDGVAAARLAYQYFFGDRTATKDDYLSRKVVEPYAITLIGEHDIWNHDDPNTLPFQHGLYAAENPKWDILLNGHGGTYLEDLISDGRVIGRYLALTNASLAKDRGFDVTIDGRLLHAINTPIKGSMVHDSAIRPEHDGCLSYAWDGTSWGCSVYGIAHKKDLDLSTISVKRGGGGHPGASGFQLKELPKELGGVESKMVPMSIVGTYQLNPKHPNPEKLPDDLHIGRAVRMHDGCVGTVVGHYICGDDCSGYFGRVKYDVTVTTGSVISIGAHEATLI